MSLSAHRGEKQQINHDPICSRRAPSYAPLHQLLEGGGGDAFRARDVNPRRGDENRAFTPASLKTPPFGHPLILVAMSSWAQWWTPVVRGTKTLGHPAMVARGGRMSGEGQAAVIPGKMSLLRRQRLGD